MPELKATSFSSLATNLVNRPVTFAPGKPVNVATPQIYAIYDVLPHDGLVVVKADVRLLASLGGALMGLPNDGLAEHIKGSSLLEPLSDAAYEILNIASKVVTATGRAVLKAVVNNPESLDQASALTIKNGQQRSYFNVTVQDYSGGMFCVFGG